MDTIELTNRIEKSETKDNVTKTLICGEAENGYVVIKRKQERPESPDEEFQSSEEVYIFKENPLEGEEKDDMSMEEGVKSLLDEYL